MVGISIALRGEYNENGSNVLILMVQNNVTMTFPSLFERMSGIMCPKLLSLSSEQTPET